MSLVVATSTVSDGSMYNRHDMFDRKVFQNRRRFIATQGLEADDFIRLWVTYETTDFCRYREISASQRKAGMMGSDTEPADALITTELGVGLFLPVADCVGAVIYDESRQVLALAHLGRHSLEQYGGTAIINYLRDHYGCEPENLRVWLTPAASKNAYQLWKLDHKGLKEATYEQLRAAGVLDVNITDNVAETTDDSRYYSYSLYLKGLRADDGDHAIIAMMT